MWFTQIHDTLQQQKQLIIKYLAIQNNIMHLQLQGKDTERLGNNQKPEMS